MTDMVEKVARAIAERRRPMNLDDDSWEREFIRCKSIFMAEARAAIRALMEPTGGMLDAREALYEMPPDREDLEDWQAMLKAALND